MLMVGYIIIGFLRLNYIKKRNEDKVGGMKQMKKTCIATVTVVAIVFALSCLLLLLSSNMLAPALAQEELKPDLTIIEIKPYHYYDEVDDSFKGEPWFNLENYVVVTVENTGDGDAEGFNVSLHINDEFFSKKEGLSLEADKSKKVPFDWTPIGDDCIEDCTFTDTSNDYELKAVADCDNDVNESESGEANNDFTEEVTVCYNGYMADHRLENVAHGTLHGGLIFTTGDGEYGGLYSVGDTRDITYEITLPDGASVELARLNVYYTWYKDKESCPEMEVSIDGTVVPLDESYNDIKCMCPKVYYVYPWGNYVYDIKDYIQGSGTYTVTVKRTGDSEFCIAAPGIILVYEDKTAPMIEYWINEGADILMGGKRADGGFLSLEECLNSATFDGEHLDLEVEKATLGVVSAWGDDEPDNVLYFNGEELGDGVYCGYHDSCSKEEDGISVSIGASEAQVGIAAFDVTGYLEGCDNEVIQGDGGDNMMPVNAFLVITYGEDEDEEEEEFFDTGSPANPYPSIFGMHNGTITVNQNITVNKMYTYPCVGTGGHSEYIEIWNATRWNVSASWAGYRGDWHNISFDEPFTLEVDRTYYYTIRTGSYPQIHHTETGELEADGGTITCTKFTDANGKTYNNWIPAIKLFLW